MEAGETTDAYRILVGNLKGRCHLGDLSKDGRITLNKGVAWIQLAQDRI
jgi:hypothetical protein